MSSELNTQDIKYGLLGLLTIAGLIYIIWRLFFSQSFIWDEQAFNANNPLNINYGNWEGQNGFFMLNNPHTKQQYKIAKFDTLEHGLKAAQIAFCAFATDNQYINVTILVWAFGSGVPGEQLVSYSKYLCGKLGVKNTSEKIDLRERFNEVFNALISYGVKEKLHKEIIIKNRKIDYNKNCIALRDFFSKIETIISKISYDEEKNFIKLLQFYGAATNTDDIAAATMMEKHVENGGKEKDREFIINYLILKNVVKSCISRIDQLNECNNN